MVKYTFPVHCWRLQCCIFLMHCSERDCFCCRCSFISEGYHRELSLNFVAEITVSTEGLEHLSVFIAVYVTVREIPPLFVLFTVIIERISSHFLFGYGTRSEGKWDTDGEKMF
ncbi:hypothetical protein AB205_0218390 [Aquarana catesbeiana]|uniref:Uncharacterized protein n=1 Tax=Aquarana catesbeiana TaxID=8400 RepID=A0A2G9RYT8_AQUCT|nr:hypothetical protein AB205_0218390 [Aquarana catesbeiana]